MELSAGTSDIPSGLDSVWPVSVIPGFDCGACGGAVSVDASAPVGALESEGVSGALGVSEPEGAPPSSSLTTILVIGSCPDRAIDELLLQP